MIVWSTHSDPYNLDGIPVINSIWYGGTGSKERMQRRANIEGHTVQLSIQEPTNGKRGFISYTDWETALRHGLVSIQSPDVYESSTLHNPLSI